MRLSRRWLAAGFALLAVALLLAPASPPGARPFAVRASAPAEAIQIASDRDVVGRGDSLNLTVWLNLTGNGQVPVTRVNVTFNTASNPSDNGLTLATQPWVQPPGCILLYPSGWLLEWECDNLRAGTYIWTIPATVPSNATVGRYQRVMTNASYTAGAGFATTSANETVWIAGSIVRIESVDSAPTESVREGDKVEFWVNATNEATPANVSDANGTGTAFDVVIRIEMDPGLQPGRGLVNLTTTFDNLPAGGELSVNLEAIVADNLTAGTTVSIHVVLTYRDFNGHALGPIEAESTPLYVVQASAFSPPNLIAGAAIGLVAILASLVVLLYLGQRKIVIDEVFLMTKGGVLIRHVSHTPGLQKDDDIVASMFVAIQEFVRDSFRREASLDAVTFGHRRAAVVRGELTILAAVASRGDVEYLIPEMLAATRAIEARYWDALLYWDGTMSRLAGIDEALNRLLSGEFRSPWRVQLT